MKNNDIFPEQSSYMTSSSSIKEKIASFELELHDKQELITILKQKISVERDSLSNVDKQIEDEYNNNNSSSVIIF